MPFLFLLSWVYQSDVNHQLSCLQYHHQTEAKTKLIFFFEAIVFLIIDHRHILCSLMPRLIKRRVKWSLATSFSLCPFLHNMHSFETHDESPVESKLKKLTNRPCCLEVLMSMSLSLMTTSAAGLKMANSKWSTPAIDMFSPAFVTTIFESLICAIFIAVIVVQKSQCPQ